MNCNRKSQHLLSHLINENFQLILIKILINNNNHNRSNNKIKKKAYNKLY